MSFTRRGLPMSANNHTDQTDTLLEVKNLVSGFYIGKKYVAAVDNCSFPVFKGKTLGIVGESGCGKSLTSLSIMRLLPANNGHIQAGSVMFEGRDLLQLSEPEMRTIRGRRISMIFQEPMTSLNPVYTVGRQIGEVFRLHLQASKQESRDLSIEMLRKVHIPSAEKRIDCYPHELSGGMRQRIMIAMALACQPAVLIADEATTALDVTIQSQILALINQLQQKNNMGVIFISHNLGVIAETCDQVAVMYAGKIVEYASTTEIFSNPQHPYTIGLLNAIPRFGKKQNRLPSIPGNVPSLGQWPPGCRFQDRCSAVSSLCKEKEPPLSTNGKRMVACFHTPDSY